MHHKSIKGAPARSGPVIDKGLRVVIVVAEGQRRDDLCHGITDTPQETSRNHLGGKWILVEVLFVEFGKGSLGRSGSNHSFFHLFGCGLFDFGIIVGCRKESGRRSLWIIDMIMMRCLMSSQGGKVVLKSLLRVTDRSSTDFQARTVGDNCRQTCCRRYRHCGTAAANFPHPSVEGLKCHTIYAYASVCGFVKRSGSRLLLRNRLCSKEYGRSKPCCAIQRRVWPKVQKMTTKLRCVQKVGKQL